MRAGFGWRGGACVFHVYEHSLWATATQSIGWIFWTATTVRAGQFSDKESVCFLWARAMRCNESPTSEVSPETICLNLSDGMV